MQLSLGKAGRQRQQAEHGVIIASGVDQRLAEHHIAAAFPVNRFALFGRRRHRLLETARPGKRAGMQFRISAGQIDRIAIGSGPLVGER